MKRSDALIPLSREHHTALVLCLRIEREVPSANDDGLREVYNDLIAFWARGLLPHFRAENECLLARLVRHVPLDDDLVQRTHRDHLVIEALVATMRDVSDKETRRQALLDFGTKLRTHIRWEEDVLFAATETQLTTEELAALGDEVTERVGSGDACALDVWPAVMKRDR
jgi:hemerythrin-like domain-containing protein